MNQETSEMLPPPAIGIPTASQTSDESENSDNGENEDVVITLFNRFDEGSVDRTAGMNSIPEDGIADDSFYQRIDEEEFKVESVNESDGSIYFKVQAPEFDKDYSNEQLLSYIEQLSNHLKRAERSLQKQKSRRRAREQTIIKMAKVLKGQRDSVEQLEAKVDELKSEIRMKETENSLSDQRLRNTMKDLRNAEIEIKSLSERQQKLDASNVDLQKKISSQGIEEVQPIITRKQQRRVLKRVTMILLCAASLTAICALFGCNVTSTKNIEGGQQCDVNSNLEPCRLLYTSTSQGAEVDGKEQLVKGSVVSEKKRRNPVVASANAVFSKTTPSSVVDIFLHKKKIH